MYSPVVLDVSCLVGKGGQVHLGLAYVRQVGQLSDDVVGHLLHEAQSLDEVPSRREDLAQAVQVLLQPRLHAAQRTGHLNPGRGREVEEVEEEEEGEEEEEEEEEEKGRVENA